MYWRSCETHGDHGCMLRNAAQFINIMFNNIIQKVTNIHGNII